MKHFFNYLLVAVALLFASTIQAQTGINTSFESPEYNVGTVNNQNSWKVTTGTALVSATADYVRTGTQGLNIFSSTTAVQTDHIPYATTGSGLGGDVYIDFYIKFKSLPSQTFSISAYDLASGSRSFMMDFQTTGKIKLYDGSSGWATQPAYTANTWTRITIKIDNAGAKCQYAIDGVVQNNLFAFREVKNAATTFKYNYTHFSMSAGTSDVAIDDMYIGSTAVSGIAFQESSTNRTITVTQPANGTITLDPVKTIYTMGDVVTASITVPDHYLFSAWTGSLSGTANPNLFTVTANMTIGATVIVDPNNPPASSTITINQPSAGGTISISPVQTTYYNGTTITATFTTASGYAFNGWTGSLSGTINPQSFVLNSNTSIGATTSIISINPHVITVTTAANFKTALTAMNPGDTILVMDGTYNIGGTKVTRGGTVLNPIVIKSKNLFGAQITGASYFNTSYQSYVTYEGFAFKVDPVSTIFKMEGCDHVRITRNWFRMNASSDTTQTSKWITIGELWDNEVCTSHHNRIDHNLFDGKHDQGAWMIIDGSHGIVPAISQHDRIDHNIFQNNTPRVTNEKETIRVGVSDLSHKDAFTVVENNLFMDCDGDPEIVSVKSNCDTIRNNTFRRCLGTISLRQGNNSVVEGNFVFAEGKTAIYGGSTIGCGGVRVYGLNHKIYNNYFEGLTGYKWDAACTLTNGDVTNTSTSLSSHFLPENIVFAFNTLVNNKSNIEIGFDNNASYGKAPINCILANNIVVANENPLVKYYSSTSLAGVSFSNNIMYSSGTSTLGLTGTTDAQIKTLDPLLVHSDCRAYGQNSNYKIPLSLYKLTAASPAINASTGDYSYVNYDFENQPAIGIRDIGADEFDAVDAIANGPVSELQAGPTAPETYVFEVYTNSTAVPTIIDNEIKAYPNPFTGKTIITLPTAASGLLSYSLYNSMGQLMEHKTLNPKNCENKIEINTYSKGILVCILESTTKKYLIKLISK